MVWRGRVYSYRAYNMANSPRLYPCTIPAKTANGKVELIGALKEVSMQEPETPWMFQEYRYILDNADRIKQVRNQGAFYLGFFQITSSIIVGSILIRLNSRDLLYSTDPFCQSCVVAPKFSYQAGTFRIRHRGCFFLVGGVARTCLTQVARLYSSQWNKKVPNEIPKKKFSHEPGWVVKKRSTLCSRVWKIQAKNNIWINEHPCLCFVPLVKKIFVSRPCQMMHHPQWTLRVCLLSTSWRHEHFRGRLDYLRVAVSQYFASAARVDSMALYPEIRRFPCVPEEYIPLVLR